MSTARTFTRAMIFTSPAVDMVLKKILRLEGMLIGKVIQTRKQGGGHIDRQITLYKNSLTPWGKRYVNPIIEDVFHHRISDPDYTWYQPRKKGYLDTSLNDMARAYDV